MEEKKEETAPSNKRKAVDDDKVPAKKTKKDATASEENQIKNLFVGNLSWNVDEEWLAREFREFGELVSTRIISDRATGRSKGFGYVEFVDAADAARALEAKKGSLIDNREANIDFSTPRTAGDRNDFKEKANNRAQDYGDSTSPESDTLFVGNVSFEATEDVLGEEFGKFGTVTHIRLPTDM